MCFRQLPVTGPKNTPPEFRINRTLGGGVKRCSRGLVKRRNHTEIIIIEIQISHHVEGISKMCFRQLVVTAHKNTALEFRINQTLGGGVKRCSRGLVKRRNNHHH